MEEEGRDEEDGINGGIGPCGGGGGAGGPYD